jgi:diacylglycerol kinase family enzyme
MPRTRVTALAALGLLAGTLALAAAAAVVTFPRGIAVLACVALALVAAWYGLVRRGVARWAGVAVAALSIGTATWLLIAREPILTALILATLWLAIVAARAAFRVHVELPAAPPPRSPVLFFNPRSGGGKASRLHVAEEARARGIEPIELAAGTDLEALVRDAVAAGADALAMAGGDGSQAIVASVAAEHGLPYACVPAGTRNHFALDLGVDRDDVIGALDAFVDGGERVVDLADVNGRVFVNNVSLGFYAQAVQRAGYREAKVRTLVGSMPEALGPEAAPRAGLHWTGPEQQEEERGAAILVSNNRYRLGRAVGSGTRPRLDDGLLGITVIDAPHGAGARLVQHVWRQWTAPSFEVHSDGPVAAGVDGEAMQLQPPLRFSAHPGTLRVRIARAHPGASPSAIQPDGFWATAGTLAALAAGRDPRPLPTAPQPVVRASGQPAGGDVAP